MRRGSREHNNAGKADSVQPVFGYDLEILEMIETITVER